MQARVADVVIAMSGSVIQLDEDHQPARYYFPREQVDMSKLTRTQTATTCPFKGLAHCFSVSANGETLTDAAWSYEDPYAEHRALKERIAFDADRFESLVVDTVR